MRRRALVLGAGGALALAAAAVGVWRWRAGPPMPGTAGGQLGRALARATAAAGAAVAPLREPYRCARLDLTADGAAGALAGPGGRSYELAGATLRIGPAGVADQRLVLGVVADARGATPETLAQVGAARAELAAHGVELVLALGGLGRDEAEIAAVLAALTDGAPWAVVAIPGDREALPAHRAAVAGLRDRGGGLVVDGSAVRFVEIDGAVIATLPGASAPSRAVAGAEGCVHEAGDAAALAAELARRPGRRVLAAHAPPRQRGSIGSDLAGGGLHIGEPALGEAMTAAAPVVAVHGLVDEAAGPGRGQAAAGEPLALATGPLEARPLGPGRTGSALVIALDGARTTWTRLALPRPH